jgi:hypothetical protein
MPKNKRKSHALQKSQTTHPIVPSPEQDGMQDLSPDLGRDVSRDGTRTRAEAGEATQAIVPIAGKFTTVRASENQSREKTLDAVVPNRDAVLSLRAEILDAEYAGDVIEGINLPPQVIETTQRWLRANNLIWSSNDYDFWAALEYVLDGLESFSVDAIEQALIICTTKASDNPARRATIYSELKSVRAIKKIRDMKLRIRTAEVVASRALITLPFARKFETNQLEAAQVEEQRQSEIDTLQTLAEERPALLLALENLVIGDTVILQYGLSNEVSLSVVKVSTRSFSAGHCDGSGSEYIYDRIPPIQESLGVDWGNRFIRRVEASEFARKKISVGDEVVIRTTPQLGCAPVSDKNATVTRLTPLYIYVGDDEYFRDGSATHSARQIIDVMAAVRA